MKEKIVKHGIHHISLKVADFEQVVSFYKALGLNEYLFWEDEGVKYILLEIEKDSYIEIASGGKKEGEQQIVNHFGFLVENCESALEIAIKAGGIITVELAEHTLSNSEQQKFICAFVKTPSGEEIELIQNL